VRLHAEEIALVFVRKLLKRRGVCQLRCLVQGVALGEPGLHGGRLLLGGRLERGAHAGQDEVRGE